MRKHLPALFVAAMICCAVTTFSSALQETEFVRALPTAYVPPKPLRVGLSASVGLTQDFYAEVYEFLPPGWLLVSASPEVTSFDPATGTAFWRVDIDSDFEIWAVPISYDVLPPAAQTGDVLFDGNASYLFYDWEGEHRGSAATTGDVSLSRGSQESRRVPEDHPTIQGAIDASLYGDTVVIGPGLYVENIEMQQGVDLKGAGWPPPEIRATSDLWQDAVITTAPHCSIHGLIISSGYCGVRGRYGPFEVRSCVITGNTFRGVDAVGSDTADRVVNCTIVHNPGTGAYLGEPSAGNLVINSIAYGNGGRDIWGGVTRFSCLQDEILNGVGENNIYADPMFANAEAGDYGLLPNSPCIDAGDNSAVQADETDVLGKPRIMFGGKSETVDMGAYEYWFISASPRPDSSDIEVSWASEAGVTYSVFRSADLATWQLANDSVLASSNMTVWLDPIGSLTAIPIRFYRVMENE